MEVKGGGDGGKKRTNMKQWKVWGRRAWDSGKYKIDGGRDRKMKECGRIKRNKRRVHRVYLLFSSNWEQ